jgi:chorismate mutase
MELEEVRRQIDELDSEIIKLLDKRFLLVEKVVEIKKEKNIETVQPKREDQVIAKVRELSNNPDVAEGVFRAVIEESKKFQEKLK